MHRRMILFVVPFWIRGIRVWKERQPPVPQKKI